MFRRIAAPMPQITNALGQLQDKYLQTPYNVYDPKNKAWFYNERGYTPGNMQNMVNEGLGEYYGRQMELPRVDVQPPTPSPGAGYQWMPQYNIWQDQRKSGSYRPGAGGNYWGQQYGQQSPFPPGFRMRDFLKTIPQANQRSFMNQLNQYFRNR